MANTRHPMRDINSALDARNRTAERICKLEAELREAHAQLTAQERKCWAVLPDGYFIALGDPWSLTTNHGYRK
jgi:hypothetical protein